MRMLKIGGVIFGALVITTLGISASDMLQGSSGSLLGQLAGTGETSVCPAGMMHVPTAATFTCVDLFEVSPGASCQHKAPRTAQESQQNINEQSCVGASLPAAQPWTAVTREQAQALCMRSGKRLPTAAEWYFFSIGTPDSVQDCNVSGSAVRPTSASSCISSVGIYDAIGNVWEWVSDDVINGMFNGRALPEEGYVSQVASDGVPTVTSRSEDELFGSDYFWSSNEGAYAMLRGGYFASGADGGLYTVQAKTSPTLATAAIGFRCVR